MSMRNENHNLRSHVTPTFQSLTIILNHKKQFVCLSITNVSLKNNLFSILVKKTLQCMPDDKKKYIFPVTPCLLTWCVLSLKDDDVTFQFNETKQLENKLAISVS